MISFAESSPEAIRQAWVADVSLRILARSVADLGPRAARQGVDLQCMQAQGPWLRPALKALAATGSDRLDPHEKRCLVRAACGNLWTGAALLHRGFGTDGCCPFCGALDDAFHRVFLCPHFAEERASRVPKSVQKAAKARGRKDPLMVWGFSGAPDLCQDEIRPDSVEVVWLDSVGEPTMVRPPLDGRAGEFYVDGSAMHPEWAEVSTAGCAAVLFNPQGACMGGMGVTLPRGLPQTAAAAERMILAFLEQQASGPLAVASDCQGALKGRSAHPATLSGKGLYDGVWKGIALDHATPGRLQGKVCAQRHVKAHRSVSQALDEADRRDIIANEMADSCAKRMATRRAVAGATNAFLAEAALQRDTARAFGRMLALWPPSKALFGTLAPPPKAVDRNATSIVLAHCWAQVELGWQCSACLQLAKNPDGASECQGSSELARLCSESSGHRLWAAVTTRGAVVIVCAGCGAYAEGRRRRLAQVCPGRPPTSALAAQRTRFWGTPSRHPAARSRQSFAGEPWPISSSSGNPAADRDELRNEVRLRCRRAPVAVAPVGPAPRAGLKRPRSSPPTPPVGAMRPPAVTVAPSLDEGIPRPVAQPLRGISGALFSDDSLDIIGRVCPSVPPLASSAKRLRPNEASGISQRRLPPEVEPLGGAKRPPPAPTLAEEWVPPSAEPRASALRRRYGR